jgi:hypothetical protein
LAALALIGITVCCKELLRTKRLGWQRLFLQFSCSS